jgi:hypothetical protein
MRYRARSSTRQESNGDRLANGATAVFAAGIAHLVAATIRNVAPNDRAHGRLHFLIRKM